MHPPFLSGLSGLNLRFPFREPRTARQSRHQQRCQSDPHRKSFLLYIPVLLGYTLPIACLVSVILSFSRLSADNEILAIRANGVHLKRLLFPLFVVGLLISLLDYSQRQDHSLRAPRAEKCSKISV